MPAHRLAPRAPQYGMGLFGLLFVIIVIGFIALVTMRVVPSAIEYQAVLKAVERARNQPTPAAIRSAFDRSAQIDDIASVSGKDLDIAPRPNSAPGFDVSFAYRKELHLFGPASLLLDYQGKAP